MHLRFPEGKEPWFGEHFWRPLILIWAPSSATSHTFLLSPKADRQGSPGCQSSVDEGVEGMELEVILPPAPRTVELAKIGELHWGWAGPRNRCQALCSLFLVTAKAQQGGEAFQEKGTFPPRSPQCPLNPVYLGLLCTPETHSFSHPPSPPSCMRALGARLLSGGLL